MKASRLFAALALCAPLATSGCIFDADDDDDDGVVVGTCETDCDDEHQECSVSCEDNTCIADCDTVRDECKLDC